MYYTVAAIIHGETISVDAPAAREAQDAYLDCYRPNFQTVAIKSEDGNPLNLERLS